MIKLNERKNKEFTYLLIADVIVVVSDDGDDDVCS